MMKERYLKETKTTKTTKAKENVLNVEIQITSSESVQNYQEATIKKPFLDDHGVIATKMKKKRLETKNVLWPKLLMRRVDDADVVVERSLFHSDFDIIPFRLFTNEWDLGALAYFKETEGSYHTEITTPEEIHQFLQFERVDSNRIIKSKNITLSPNQVLTKELRHDLKRWNELIYENVFGLGGHRDHLPAYLAHILYCILAEQQYNLAYFFVKRIESARATPKAHLPYGMFLTRLFRHVMEHYPYLENGIYNVVERVMRPLALRQARRPRSDCGKARHSVSSTFAHHNCGSSSRQEDDDEDDGASRASTPSPTTYLNSLKLLNYQ
nr:ribosomal protein L7Ae/L30e/S12e/Gadd45 [Tanacetum cinerariifolium]